MIDLELANVRHGIFVLHLELLVNGIEDITYDPAVMGDDAVCDLGRWLGDTRWLLAERQEYAHLVDVHKAFHRHAGEIVRRFNADDHAGAKDMLDQELAKSSLSIYVAIDRLKLALRQERENQMAEGRPAHRWLDALASGNAPGLMTGIAVVDDQHREIAALLARLLAKPERKLRDPDVRSDLNALGVLMKRHFAAEEQIMRHAVVPEVEMALHHDEHGQLQLRYDQVLASLGDESTIRDVSASFLVEQWVLDHIQGHDLKLGRLARDTTSINPDEIAPPPS